MESETKKNRKKILVDVARALVWVRVRIGKVLFTSSVWVNRNRMREKVCEFAESFPSFPLSASAAAALISTSLSSSSSPSSSSWFCERSQQQQGTALQTSYLLSRFSFSPQRELISYLLFIHSTPSRLSQQFSHLIASLASTDIVRIFNFPKQFEFTATENEPPSTWWIWVWSESQLNFNRKISFRFSDLQFSSQSLRLENGMGRRKKETQ